jgi:hypothetical protein
VLDQQYLVNLPTISYAALTLNVPKHVRRGGARISTLGIPCLFIAVPRVVEAQGDVDVQILDKQEYQPSKADGGLPVVDE